MTTSELVERFLATQDRSTPAPGYATSGADWRALARELGVPCPDALALLGDAAMEYAIAIYVSSDVVGGDAPGTSFELLDPSRARHTYDWNRGERSSFEAWAVARYTVMLPFAGIDGDALLVDAAGAVHWLPFTLPGRARQVADSIDALLAATIDHLATVSEGPP